MKSEHEIFRHERKVRGWAAAVAFCLIFWGSLIAWGAPVTAAVLGVSLLYVLRMTREDFRARHNINPATGAPIDFEEEPEEEETPEPTKMRIWSAKHRAFVPAQLKDGALVPIDEWGLEPGVGV